MTKIILYASLILQVIIFALLLIGLDLNRKSQDNPLLYIVFSLQILVLIAVIYVRYRKIKGK